MPLHPHGIMYSRLMSVFKEDEDVGEGKVMRCFYSDPVDAISMMHRYNINVQIEDGGAMMNVTDIEVSSPDFCISHL